MTQLTLNQRFALVKRQHSAQVPSDSESDSDENDLMARVRRNSVGGRSRGREAAHSDSQRSIRSKAHPAEVRELVSYPTDSLTLRTFDQSTLSHGIPPPPQLVTSQYDSNRSHYSDALGLPLLSSPDGSAPSLYEYETVPYAPEVNYVVSPPNYTPSQSASSERAGSSIGFSLPPGNNRIRSDSGSTNFLDKTLHHGKSYIF